MTTTSPHRTARRRPAPPPAAKFAVVTNPGTLFEAVDSYTATYAAALEVLEAIAPDFPSVDVMKVTPLGTLTTEF